MKTIETTGTILDGKEIILDKNINLRGKFKVLLVLEEEYRQPKKEEILEYLNNFLIKQGNNLGIEKLGLFGSYARGEETENSDIDVAVKFSKDTEDIFENKNTLRDLLEEKFQCKIDVLNMDGIKPKIKDLILKEMIF